MYFPPSTPSNNDIIEQLMRLESLPYREQLYEVKKLYDCVSDSQIRELIYQIERKIKDNLNKERETAMHLRALESQNDELKYEIEDHRQRLSSYAKEINELHKRLSASERNDMISPSPKGYKNLFIFLFAHPNNHSNATKEILRRMNYLEFGFLIRK